MKPFEFTVVNPVNGSRGRITVNEINQRLALKEANRKAKHNNLILVY